MRRLFAFLLLLLLISGPTPELRAAISGFVPTVTSSGSSSPINTTTRFINDSTSASVANTPTQTFGFPVKDGDICGGGAPIFTVSGVQQPYSHGLYSYWNSGCLKFVAIRLRPSFSVAAPAQVTASISGTVMCVTATASGSVTVGQYIDETATAGVVANTYIVSALGSCGGGTSYTVSVNYSGGAPPAPAAVASSAMKLQFSQTVTVTGRNDGTLCGLNNDGTINNTGGTGNWPCSSGRTEQDIYNQKFMINAPKTPASGGNLSADQGAWLCNGSGTSCTSNATNLIQHYCYMDGGAGLDCHYSYWLSPTSGGTKQGQLVGDFFVQAFNDSGSALGGFRVLGQLRQPFYNLGNAPGVQYNFCQTGDVGCSSGVGISANGGGVVSLTMPAAITSTAFLSRAGTFTGYVTAGVLTAVSCGTATSILPYDFNGNVSYQGDQVTGSGFTAGTYVMHQVSGSSTACSSGATYNLNNNFTAGSSGSPLTVSLITSVPQATGIGTSWWQGTNGYQINSVFLNNTGGSLPTGLDANTIYYLDASQHATADYPILSTSSANPGSPLAFITGACTGTCTFNPTVTVLPFTKVNITDSNGRYMFFQGTGSITAETTLRNRWNQTYAQSTGLLPTYNLADIENNSVSDLYQCSVNADFACTSSASWNYNYYWASLANANQPAADEGELLFQNAGIGMLPNEVAMDFFNQTQRSERSARAWGLTSDLLAYDFKDGSTLANLNTTNASYTGLNAPGAGPQAILWDPGFNASGFTAPASVLPFGYQASDTSHRPQYGHYQLMKYGELQYLNVTIEAGLGGLLTVGDSRNGNVGATNYYGTAAFVLGEFRSQAREARDLFIAAADYPFNPTNASYLPLDGSQTGQMLRDQATTTTAVQVAQMNPANSVYGSAGTYFQSTGIYPPCCTPAPNVFNIDASPWQRGIFAEAWFYAISALQDTNAATMLGYYHTNIVHILNTFGGSPMGTYYETHGINGDYISHRGQTGITDDAHWGANPPYNISWTPSCTASAGTRCLTSVGQVFAGPGPFGSGTSCTSTVNCDELLWLPNVGSNWPSGEPPGGVSADTPTYVCDATGSPTFQFNLCDGSGTRINITTNADNTTGLVGNGYIHWQPAYQGNTPPGILASAGVTTGFIAYAGYLGERCYMYTALNPGDTQCKSANSANTATVVGDQFTRYGVSEGTSSVLTIELGPRYDFQDHFGP